jgi:hypothetical protein
MCDVCRVDCGDTCNTHISYRVGSTSSAGPSPFSFSVGPTFKTIQGVAVEPPSTTAVVQKKVGGMVVTELQSGLRELKVVTNTTIRLQFDPITLKSGDSIYVNSVSISKYPWSKDVYEVDDLKFIVVPYEFVVAVRS